MMDWDTVCRFFKGDNECRGELFLISTVDTSQSVISECFCYKVTFNIFTYVNQINDMEVFFLSKRRDKICTFHLATYSSAHTFLSHINS